MASHPSAANPSPPTTSTSTPTTELNTLLKTPVIIIESPSQNKRYFIKPQPPQQQQLQQPQQHGYNTGRMAGSTNYTSHDTDVLLDIVDRIRPIGNMLWQRVCEEFNTNPGISVGVYTWMPCTHVCLYECMYVCMYVCMFVCIMHACTHVCIHVCMCIC